MLLYSFETILRISARNVCSFLGKPATTEQLNTLH